MKELTERDWADPRAEVDNGLPEFKESRVPNSFLDMMQTPRVLRHADDPTNQPQKSLPHVAPVNDDVVWKSNVVDGSNIIDEFELFDYYVPKRRFSTDT